MNDVGAFHAFGVYVGVIRMHDCLPIGTVPNHVHRYTLVYWESNSIHDDDIRMTGRVIRAAQKV